MAYSSQKMTEEIKIMSARVNHLFESNKKLRQKFADLKARFDSSERFLSHDVHDYSSDTDDDDDLAPSI